MKRDAYIAIELSSHEGLVRQAYKDSVGGALYLTHEQIDAMWEAALQL